MCDVVEIVKTIDHLTKVKPTSDICGTLGGTVHIVDSSYMGILPENL